LSQTIKGLHWDQIPGDNDDEVAARGILYLLIFQQLGQMLRWSWGLNVLLQKSAGENIEGEHVGSDVERGQGQGIDTMGGEYEPLIAEVTTIDPEDAITTNRGVMRSIKRNGNEAEGLSPAEPDLGFGSGEQTPVTSRQYTSSVSSQDSLTGRPSSRSGHGILHTPANGNLLGSVSTHQIKQSSRDNIGSPSEEEPRPQRPLTVLNRYAVSFKSKLANILGRTSTRIKTAFASLPSPLQSLLTKILGGVTTFVGAIWQSMNPPLFAMAFALLVASIPSLQRLFFSDGTFVKNSITSAIRQSGGVAVPLILVVLGANLARVSDPNDALRAFSEDDKIETKLVVASLTSRMVLPTIFMAPMLALAAKYLSISILDDPIFIIVCFLLAGAPSALQLAQICQINEVYMGAMTRILFHSYVIW
jgi:predicted permease